MSAVKDAFVVAKASLLDKRQEVYNEAYNESKAHQDEGFKSFYSEQQEKVSKQKADLDAAFAAAVSAKRAEIEAVAKAAADSKTRAIDEEIARLDEAIARCE